MEYTYNRKKGSSLLELLLYISIASVMLLVITTFLVLLLESRIKNSTISEVDLQGAFIMQMMTQTIRNSSAINTPAASSTATSLDLSMPLSIIDPTVFSVAGGSMTITEATSSSVALTNSYIIVSDVVFSNLSYTDTYGTIGIEFTISHSNPEGRNEYEYTKVFRGAASLRGGTIVP